MLVRRPNSWERILFTCSPASLQETFKLDGRERLAEPQQPTNNTPGSRGRHVRNIPQQGIHA